MVSYTIVNPRGVESNMIPFPNSYCPDILYDDQPAECQETHWDQWDEQQLACFDFEIDSMSIQSIRTHEEDDLLSFPDDLFGAFFDEKSHIVAPSMFVRQEEDRGSSLSSFSSSASLEDVSLRLNPEQELVEDRIKVVRKKRLPKLTLSSKDSLLDAGCGNIRIIKRKIDEDVDIQQKTSKKRKLRGLEPSGDQANLVECSESLVLIVEFLMTNSAPDLESRSYAVFEPILMTVNGACKPEPDVTASISSSCSYKFRLVSSQAFGDIDIVLIHLSQWTRCSGAVVHLTTGDQTEQLGGPFHVKNTDNSRSTTVMLSSLRISSDGKLEQRKSSIARWDSHDLSSKLLNPLRDEAKAELEPVVEVKQPVEEHVAILDWSAVLPTLNQGNVGFVLAETIRAPLTNYDDILTKRSWEALEHIKLKLRDIRKNDYLTTITKKDLVQLISLSRADISKGLGICLSLTKKIFRAHGLREWVYRYLSPIRSRMKRLVNDFDSKVSQNTKLSDMEIRSQRDIYETEMKSLVELHQRTAQTFLENWQAGFADADVDSREENGNE